MPTPHYSLSPVNRGSTRKGVVRPACGGGSATARAAYIDRGGQYAARAADVLARGHVGPDLGDWSGVDRWERRKDAVVAREIIAAVSHCLTLTQQIAVAQEHAEYLRRVHGVAVKWALHLAGDGDHRNTHIHFLLTTRKVSDDCRPSETKIKSLDRKTGGRDAVAAMRGAWQHTVNAALAAAGRSERLDLRTLAAQGIEREAQQRVPTAEYIRARRGEILSKRYERNQRLAAFKAAIDALTRIHTELTAARRAERRERAGRAVERSKRSVARSTRRVASSQQLAERTARSLGASADYSRGEGAALEHRLGRRRTGPPTVRAELLRAAGSHLNHERRERRVPERHPDRLGGDEQGRRSDRHDDAEAGELNQRAEGRLASEGAVVAVSTAAVPAAEAKAGFFQRLWRRLIGAASKDVAPAAAVPLAQTRGRTPPKLTDAQEETRAKPSGKPPEVKQASVSVAPRKAVTVAVEVLQIETPKGGEYYVRKTDWENRAARIDVPLCDVAGQAVKSGQRARLRVSTILTCKLVPVATPSSAQSSTNPDISEYLVPPIGNPPENPIL